jgi:hypothetical protein
LTTAGVDGRSPGARVMTIVLRAIFRRDDNDNVHGGVHVHVQVNVNVESPRD